MLHRFMTCAGVTLLALLASACDQGPEIRVEFRNEALAARQIAGAQMEVLPVVVESADPEAARAMIDALDRARPDGWPRLVKADPETVGIRDPVVRIVFEPDAFYSGISICQGRRIGGDTTLADKLAIAAALCAQGRRLVSVRAHSEPRDQGGDPALEAMLDSVAAALFRGL